MRYQIFNDRTFKNKIKQNKTTTWQEPSSFLTANIILFLNGSPKNKNKNKKI